MHRSLIIALSLWATPAFAAGGGWSQVAFHTINLAVLVWLLIKFAGKPINRAIKAKAEQIEKDISEASRLHAQAKAMLDDYEQKLSRLDAEAGELLEQYRADGEEEKARIIREAEAEARRIKEEAERSAANEIARARARLESELADLAIAAAEETIRQRLNPADHRKLTADYLGQLEDTLRG